MTIRMAAYLVTVSTLLGVAALLIEHGEAWLRLPRRWTWTVGLLSILALTCWLPWRQPATASDLVIVSAAGPLASVTSSLGRWWSQPDLRPSASGDRLDAIVVATWVFASGLLTMFYAVGILHLRRLRRRWPTAVRGRYSILVSEDVGPAVVGLWSTHIVVPLWALELDAAHVELLLRHEHAHQTAHDSVLVHFAELAVAVMPWNPAAWWMRMRLRTAIELDCDARVLAPRGREATTAQVELEAYGDLLLTVASRPRARSIRLIPALIERPSAVERRILAMHPIARRFCRSRFTTASVIAAALVVAAVMVPAPTLHAQYDRDRGAYRAGTRKLVRPVVIATVKPTYTTDGMRAQIQGNVQIEAIITPDGTVKDARITKSVDRAHGLDEQALKAARQWTFRPATLDGKPVPVIVTLDMTFKLR